MSVEIKKQEKNGQDQMWEDQGIFLQEDYALSDATKTASELIGLFQNILTLINTPLLKPST